MHAPLETPLQKLMKSPNFSADEALRLVRTGQDKNTQIHHGISLLHLLVLTDYYYHDPATGTFNYKHAAAIEELVKEHHADINAADANNLTPLGALLDKHCSAEQIMHLVRLGANPNTVNSQGQSVFHWLVATNKRVGNNFCNNKTIHELRRKWCANIELVNKQGQTPLKALLGLMKPGMFTEDLRERAMYLIQLGAKPDTRSDTNDCLFHILLRELPKPGTWIGNTCWTEIAIRSLVTNFRFNPDTPGGNGKSALKTILDNKEQLPDWVQRAMMLVRLGADPRTIDSNHTSLLMNLIYTNTNDCNTQAIKELKENYTVSLNDHFYEEKERIIDPLKRYTSMNSLSSFFRTHKALAEQTIVEILRAATLEDIAHILEREVNAHSVYDIDHGGAIKKGGYLRALEEGQAVMERFRQPQHVAYS